jgi:hypothetical protein
VEVDFSSLSFDSPGIAAGPIIDIIETLEPLSEINYEMDIEQNMELENNYSHRYRSRRLFDEGLDEANIDINIDTDMEMENLEEEESRRRLSTTIDFATGETTVTYDGKVPQSTCPMGYYRPPGSSNLHRITGQRMDGCRPCPRGRYGSSTGQSSSTCTAPCPVGRYGANLAATSVADCEFCPLGRYGISSGLTSAKCTAHCPSGTYGARVGLIQSSSCTTCSPGMMTGQCQWAIQPRFSIDIDHQHHEVYGLKTNFKDPLPQSGKTS